MFLWQMHQNFILKNVFVANAQKFDLKNVFCGKCLYFCPGGMARRTSHPPQEREEPGSNHARASGF
jgi:Fe-S-cluster-containing hydrogenase component 2